MKKFTLFAAVLCVLAGALGAQTRGNPPAQPAAPDTQTVTLNGTVTMDSGEPAIKADGKTWIIEAPLRSIVFLPWKDGAKVSITGQAIPASTLGRGVTVADRIIAKSITLDGKTYEIPAMGRGRGGFGMGGDGMDDDDMPRNGRDDDRRGRRNS